MSGQVRLRRIPSLALPMVVAASLVVVSQAGPAMAAGAGQVKLVSHTPASRTTTPIGTSETPVMSGDGAFVAFASTSSNLVPGQVDTNSAADVFLLERATGAVTLVSHTPAGATTSGDSASSASSAPSISADGAFVTFASLATNLVAGQSDANGDSDVFLFSRATGAVTLASHTPAGAGSTGSGGSTSPAISADGAFVAFESVATNLVAGSDANGDSDVFLFSRATGAVTLASHTPAGAGTTGNGGSGGPSISADGAFVEFASLSTNLVAGQSDTNGGLDVFLFARGTGAVTLVSHTPAGAGTTGNGYSFARPMSADGGFVAFDSLATDLVAGQSDTNADVDTFLFARATGAVALVTHTPAGAGTTGTGGSASSAISADGAFVAFFSVATDLVAGQTDTNSAYDVFLYTRSTGAVTLVSHTAAGATIEGNALSFVPSISADGAFVTFSSKATDLVAAQTDTNSAYDVFLYTRSTGAVTLVSHAAAGATTTGNSYSSSPSISADGAYVAFASLATNLVAGQSDTNGNYDVFLFKRTAGHPPVSDFNGDGTSDIAVFRPSNGGWYIQGQAGAVFGTSTDIPVPGDYNGDGITDIAVFRPSNGAWYVLGQAGAVFGTSTDIPVPGDYNGDGTTDIAVFRPSNGGWYVLGQAGAVFGISTDTPVPADYNGDGTTDIAVFRPSNGAWYVLGQAGTIFGASGDKPVAGDFNADGTSDVAVFRPGQGAWYIQGQTGAFFGTSTDIPV